MEENNSKFNIIIFHFFFFFYRQRNPNDLLNELLQKTNQHITEKGT